MQSKNEEMSMKKTFYILIFFMAFGNKRELFAVVAPVACGSDWTKALNHAETLVNRYSTYASQTGNSTYTGYATAYVNQFATINALTHKAPTTEACQKAFSSIKSFITNMESNVSYLENVVSQTSTPTSNNSTTYSNSDSTSGTNASPSSTPTSTPSSDVNSWTDSGSYSYATPTAPTWAAAPVTNNNYSNNPNATPSPTYSDDGNFSNYDSQTVPGVKVLNIIIR